MDLTNDDAHWLAGLLEGEGTFLHGPPSAPNTPRIRLEMTDRDVIEHAGRLMQRKAHPSERHPERGWKPSYSVTLKGPRAVRWMLGLRSLMSQTRQRQIDRALHDYAPRRWLVGTSMCCIEAGCGLPVKGRDLCHKHYQRLLRRNGGKAPRLTAQAFDPGLRWHEAPLARLNWLAGLLEGEGSFLEGPPSGPLTISIRLKMADREVVDRGRATMKSSRPYVIQTPERGWRPVYETILGSRRAEALMRELRPLMGDRRRAQIDRALACRANMTYQRLVPAPPRCVTDGCDRKPRGRGLCHKHYMRWSRTSGSSAIKERRKTGANMK